MLISTKPNSKGKESAIFRSRQLTDFQWTPIGDIPVYTKKTGKTKLPAGEKQTGMIYSSTEPTDKFIAENISFETFLTIVANPESALYKKDLGGRNNSWAYFGIVCNGLVRYSLNIKGRYSTKRWHTIPGMRKIADESNYSADRIELCDVLHAFCEEHHHVALITDILRDESGKIRKIEVSEAVRPTCKRAQYDLETFYEKYKRFALWRYDYIDSVPMPDKFQSKYLELGVPALSVISVDYGNKTNYREYEDVVISAFKNEENDIEIYKDGKVTEKFKISGIGNVSRRFDKGYYTLKHITTGEQVEFCVTAPQISHTVENGKITVKADPCDAESRIVYMDFREKSKRTLAGNTMKDGENSGVSNYPYVCTSLSALEILSEFEKESGVIIRDIPEDAGYFKVYFENKYGIWTHSMIKI